MEEEKNQHTHSRILDEKQEAILDLYLKKLDEFLDAAKETDQAQVEIETQHLKKILTK